MRALCPVDVQATFLSRSQLVLRRPSTRRSLRKKIMPTDRHTFSRRPPPTHPQPLAPLTRLFCVIFCVLPWFSGGHVLRANVGSTAAYKPVHFSRANQMSYCSPKNRLLKSAWANACGAPFLSYLGASEGTGFFGSARVCGCVCVGLGSAF